MTSDLQYIIFFLILENILIIFHAFFILQLSPVQKLLAGERNDQVHVLIMKNQDPESPSAWEVIVALGASGHRRDVPPLLEALDESLRI